ncbi:MAG TPA: hypothetical protein VN722_10675 [Hanamia sp.]|nr:hypothetical protein [Hanamia sp.]
MRRRLYVFILPLMLSSALNSVAQIKDESGFLNSSEKFNKFRFVTVVVSESALATIATRRFTVFVVQEISKEQISFF